MIIVESKRKKREKLIKKYPNAIFADVTSVSDSALKKLSPFYPWGDIPVPYTHGMVASCVEAIWQGLKVFEKADVDIETFNNNTMHGIKRATKKFGKVLGHRRGVYGHVLFDYLEARKRIYIPTYRWMLENKAYDIIKWMREVSKERIIVLLDYETNCDIDNIAKPLSHAFLIKAYVEGLSPFEDVKERKIHHHYCYCGRRDVYWTTEDIVFKDPQTKKQSNGQLLIDFDY